MSERHEFGNFSRVSCIPILMRGRGALIQFTIALVLFLAQVPSSALAGLFLDHKDCAMPCCSGTTAPAPKKPVACHLDSNKASSVAVDRCHGKTKPSENRLLETTKQCDCSISAPSDSSSQAPVIAPSSSSIQIQFFDAVLPSDPVRFDWSLVDVTVSGHFGSDSGPPTQGPHCVWLGRAPPVFLA